MTEPYVPTLELTAGQAAPIAANGGMSYMSLDHNGDAGTAAATKAALQLIAKGSAQTVTDQLENAPPGPIDTPWGIGFRRYAECLAYIKQHNITHLPAASQFHCATRSTKTRPTPSCLPTHCGKTQPAKAKPWCQCQLRKPGTQRFKRQQRTRALPGTAHQKSA